MTPAGAVGVTAVGTEVVGPNARAKFDAEVSQFSGSVSPAGPHLRDLARHQSAVSGDDGKGGAGSLILGEGLKWPCALAAAIMAAAALVEVGQVRSERTSRRCVM